MDAEDVVPEPDELMVDGNAMDHDGVADPPANPDPDNVASPDSSLLIPSGPAEKNRGLVRHLHGISQRTKRSSRSGSVTGSQYATPPQAARGPNRLNESMNLLSPMRYTPGHAPQTPNSITTPGRRLARHDVGDGMEVPGHGRNAPPANDEQELYIWGTSVNINQCRVDFRHFLETFEKGPEDDLDDPDIVQTQDPNEAIATGKYYVDVMTEIAILEQPQLNLNCMHLKRHNDKLYFQLIAYPQEVIPMFDIAAMEIFNERYPARVLPGPIQVRPFNLHKTSVMRQMNPEDIDRLVSIHGMVIRTSNVVPELRDVVFMCNVCEHRVHGEIIRGKITEPTVCQNCNSTHSYGVMHNLSRFSDVQLVKLQESQEDMPPGQTPHTILVYVHDSLVDTVQAGDRIIVTGVYRAVSIRPNPRQQVIRAVYKTNIDVVHFQRKDKRRLNEVQEELEQLNLSEQRIRQIETLAARPDAYEALSRALAPSIYEQDDIKKGVLLQLLGGSKKDFSKVGRGRPRCEINVLMCGDPGTSKSQMLQYVHKVAPRGQYTSGKGSSAVGLTAYVTRDPDTRQFALQSGALVLSDNGVCCIDEFDKMNESTRSVLHEVMEQQTLSVAKAGIICQLNARTSILAAANPIESQWNKDKTIIENIQLPHTLLSRFDLIFLVLDPQDEAYDKRLARHLVSIYYRSQEEEAIEEVDLNLLKDFIAYARHHCNPKLDDTAGEELVQQYVEMRRIGKGRGQISAYPRQLESLIRLSEARAKVRLAKSVTSEDVKEAIRLHKEAMKQAATDPLSGRIDLSILTTGISTAARQRRAELAAKLKDYLQTKLGPGTFPHALIFDQFRAASTLTFTRDQFEEAVKELGEGVVTAVGRNLRVS